MSIETLSFEHTFIKMCIAAIPYLQYRFKISLIEGNYDNAIIEMYAIKRICNQVIGECKCLKKGGD